jgi:AAA family ATP:ADP antiporter
MATVIGFESIDRLFSIVFAVMLVAVPLYGWVVARVSRRWLVPLVYRFFSVWLLGFYWLLKDSDEPSFMIACTFFVWVSVFNLFAVSVFWSVMADLFSSEQGKRLFGVISAGGSLGGLVSSLFVAHFASKIGVANLLLVPVVVLELSLVCAWLLHRHCRAETDRDATDELTVESSSADTEAGTGGSIFEGFLSVLQSRYLIGICIFLLLGKFCATAIYMQLIGVVETQVASIDRRAQLFALENSTVQFITIVFQLILTAQFMRNYGLAFTLGILPVGLIAGFAALAIEPTLLMAFFVQVMQRSIAYGVANPAREVLFTVVPREQKYKSKGFLDTAIFRGGDALSSRLCAALSNTGVGGATILTTIMIPAAILWSLVSWSLGRQQKQLVQQPLIDAA